MAASVYVFHGFILAQRFIRPVPAPFLKAVELPVGLDHDEAGQDSVMLKAFLYA